jgi:hypothetical protein
MPCNGQQREEAHVELLTAALSPKAAVVNYFHVTIRK